MSKFLPLLPLALDAGSPHEADHVVEREPQALEQAPAPATRTRAVNVVRATLLVVFLAFTAWQAFTTAPAERVVTTQDSACPAQ